MTIGEEGMEKMTKFKYLGSVIQNNGEINENVMHRNKMDDINRTSQLNSKVNSTELQLDLLCYMGQNVDL